MIAQLDLTIDPAQIFIVQLGAIKYRCYVKYNDRSGVWTLDLSEEISGLILLQGVPLVLGQDLLEPYNFGIGRLFLFDTSVTSVDATADDLGSRVVLIWFSPDEDLSNG